MNNDSVLHKHYTLRRLSIALLIGIICVLLSLLSSFLQLQEQARKQQQLTLSQISSDILNQRLFNKRWHQSLRKQIGQPCDDIRGSLQQAATRDREVRSYLLIKAGQIYCSSANIHDESQVVNPILPQLLQQAHGLMFSYDHVGGCPLIVHWQLSPGKTDQGVISIHDIYALTHQLLQPRPPFVDQLALQIGAFAALGQSGRLVDAASLPQPRFSWKDQSHEFSLHLYGPSGIQLLPLLIGMPLQIAFLIGLCGAMLTFRLYSLRQHVSLALSAAIRQQRLQMHYQPLIDSHSGRCIGVEALLRWHYSASELLSPEIFIPLIEQHRLMPRLTHYLMKLIAQDALLLPVKQLPAHFRMSVNISADHFDNRALLAHTHKLRKHLPAGILLVLEITESSPLSFSEPQQKLFGALLNIGGIALALDDFGTGHCSLSYLQRIQPQYLKIDKRFTRSIDNPGMGTAVLDSIINLAQRLQISVVAEGVESLQQREYLQEKGVQTLQGFLFAKPMQIDALRVWLGRNRCIE
ncbi:MAG: EAL domain-containing protein [Plesiomonas sp.]|uniref:EAL domain-containing protein n=1 Tax=Plesiomonas sp. TaxID=2486279 RepID=UPI003F3B8EC2